MTEDWAEVMMVAEIPRLPLAYLRELRRAAELKESPLGEGEDESVASFVRRHEKTRRPGSKSI